MINNYHSQLGRAVICIVLPVILFLQIFCSASGRGSDGKEIRKINLFYKCDLIKSDNGQKIVVSDSLSIYYLRNIILYEIPIFTEFTNVITDSDGNMIDEKLIRTEIKHKYFIFKKNSDFGLKYDSISARKGTQFSVDSFLNRKAFKTARFYQKENYNLSKSSWNDTKDVLIEEYAIGRKPDESYNDTTIFYFTKDLMGIDYTFSKELDSVKSMKLFKVKMITNPIPKGVYTFDIPRREMLFEISEEPVSNSKEISRLIKRFEN